MSRFCSLPDEVLKLVMHYVPLRERLASCCLVNKGFHAAAVATTRGLDWDYWSFDTEIAGRADNLLIWLGHYGQQLTHLKMNSFPRPLQELPCPNLQELVLSDRCSLQLGPAADGTPGVIQGCTKLTRLELRCNIIDAPAGAVLDEHMSQLLQLEHLQVVPTGAPYEYFVGGLPGSTLPCLKHLTHLEVYTLSAENIAQLGGLTNLQELVLHTDVVVGPRSVPGFVFPSSLTKLELCSPVEAGLLPLVPAGLKDFVLRCFVGSTVEAHISLLSSMARLQHLTRLLLHPPGDLNWPPAGPAYSALTASSQLVEFSACIRHEMPVGIWQHVFPANRCLSQLTRLELDLPELEGAEPALSGAWGAADVSSFVSCCPNVVEIDALDLQHGEQVSRQLQQLTALTALEVHYVPGGMSALQGSLKGLAVVTQLEQLYIVFDTHSPAEVTMAGLLPLTSLTKLTDLRCACWSVIPEDISADKDAEFDDVFYQEGPDPDVWLQLLERCAVVQPTCQPTALRSLAQQLGEQRALTARQQQQMLEQQQQLSAQQQVVAEQGAQIAGLQGQLQVMQAQLQELLQRQHG